MSKQPQIVSITEEQFFDYVKCPIYYFIKARGNFKIEEPITMRRLLNQIVTSFCVSLANGVVLSPGKLKQKWDILCKHYPDYLDLTRAREGVEMLVRMYRWAEQNEIRVLDVGSPYAISIIDSELEQKLEYQGVLGIIVLNPRNKPEHLIFDFSKKYPDQAALDLSFKTTLDHLGFRQLYHMDLVGTRVHSLHHDKDYYTIRDLKSERPRVAEIIKNTYLSIQKKYWYPHETPMCRTCQVRDFCMMFGRDRY